MGGTSSRSAPSSSRSHGRSTTVSPYRKELEEIYEELCQNGMLHKDLFMSHFSVPAENIAEHLFKELTDSGISGGDNSKNVYQKHHHREHLMNKESFISKAHKIIDKAYKAKRDQLEYYYDLIAHKKAELSQNDVLQILSFCCMFGHLVGNHPTSCLNNIDQDPFVISMSKACLAEKEAVSKNDFLHWVEETNPEIFAAFQSWIHAKLTSSIPKSHFQMLPVPDDMDIGSSSGILTPSLLWYLCCTLPPCYTQPDKHLQSHDENEDHTEDRYTWNMLYNSDNHGLSMNRFKHKCMDYKSPNVSLFRFRSGLLLALTLDTAWQDSSQRFGGPYSSLRELEPNPTLVIGMPNIVYLKSTGRNVHTGLQVGDGVPEKFKLDSDFSKAEVVYKGGVVDEVIRVEVWGCGGVHATRTQQKQKAWDKREVEKRGKVKLPGKWEENPDRSLLEMGGVCVSHNERQDI